VALTDTKLRNLKPVSRATKLYDTLGLFLLCNPPSQRNPKGSRLWRYKYYYAGKEKLLAFGAYPDLSLQLAREQRDKARRLLAQNVDPGEQKRLDYDALRESASNSFESVAREWLDRQKSKLDEITLKKADALLTKWAFPWIGARPVSAITPKELLEKVLRRVESRGKIETVHRLKQRCGQIFRYAIATGRAERDPTPDLRGALATSKTRSHAAITDPKKIGELLRAIDGFDGQFVTLCALKITPLVFVRPGELRRAEWKEIDMDGAMWSIPAERMKMDAPHVVPLAKQTVHILRDLYPYTGKGLYIFPGARTWQRPMSENTVNAALRRLGYDGSEIVAHGFRSMASTLLNEQGWSPDVIERQLAHAERNEVRRAYNRAKYLQERAEMMQAWADYLDSLRQGANVISIKKAIRGG
jgi:integrase